MFYSLFLYLYVCVCVCVCVLPMYNSSDTSMWPERKREKTLMNKQNNKEIDG